MAEWLVYWPTKPKIIFEHRQLKLSTYLRGGGVGSFIPLYGLIQTCVRNDPFACWQIYQ